MFDFIRYSLVRPKISDEVLKNQLINVINRSDVSIDKSSKVITTGFGEYYKGKYLTQKVSIKVVNITKDEAIINEFLLWQFYQKKSNHILHMIGVCIIGSEALIIFKPFSFTLGYALTHNLLSFENILKISLQCLELLKLFYLDGRSLMDFRPETIGLTETLTVKLLDFGLLVNMESMPNTATIQSSKIKYTPPEYIKSRIMHLSYDIWSFGCLLIDLFSFNFKLIKSNLLEEEINEGIQHGYFPTIPKDINCVIKAIIRRCLHMNPEKRISIDELSYNMKVVVDNFSQNSTLGEDNCNANANDASDDLNKTTNCTAQEPQSDNEEINENFQIISKINEQIAYVNGLINGELQEGTTNMKHHMVKIQERGIQSIIDNHSALEKILKRLKETQTRQIIYLKDKILEKILNMQDYFSETLLDLIDIQNKTNELKLSMKTLNQFNNRDQYEDIFKDFNFVKESIRLTFERYSETEHFDKVLSLYESNKDLVNIYQSFTCKCNDMIEEFIASLSKYEVSFTKEPQKMKIADCLGIQNEFIQHEFAPSDRIDNSNNIMPNTSFVKAQDNSSIVVVYNTMTKTLHHCVLGKNQIISQFNSKSYSYNDQKNKIVYISGGLQNPKDKYSYSTDFYRLKYMFNEEKYAFNIEALASMRNSRCSHSMTMTQDNNYLFAIGGINTKTCECYSVKDDKWEEFPTVPSFVPNPSVYEFQSYLFVFAGSGGVDAIYTIKISQISALFDGDYNEAWVSVAFSIPEGRLRRGMGVLSIEDSIYLLGGFDNDNKYEEIYEMNMNIQNNQENNDDDNNQPIFIVKKLEQKLPIKSYFTTNIFQEGNYFIMVDGMNNGLEYNIETKEFYYYT